MNLLNFSLLILSSVLALCNCALPPTFKKCHRKQNDFNECLQIAVQDAVQQLTAPIKEIGLPSLDPLEIPEATAGASGGSAQFDQKFKNMTVSGFSKCSCLDVIFEENLMGARCVCPQFIVRFEYEIKGRVLVLPIQGKGLGTVTALKANISLVFGLERYSKRGKQHYRVTNTKFEMTPEEMIFNYQDFFGDNKALNENINQVFNENWRELYEDVGKAYEQLFEKVFESLFARVLAKVSIEELFGEE